jgi:hypothetical protein
MAKVVQFPPTIRTVLNAQISHLQDVENLIQIEIDKIEIKKKRLSSFFLGWLCGIGFVAVLNLVLHFLL